MVQPVPLTIAISPIGRIDTAVIEAVARGVHDVIGLPTQVNDLLTNIDFAWNQNRDQYHSTPILARLAELSPPQFLKIIAITKFDLFIPILTYVYGEAQLGGKACIISTFRLNEKLSDVKIETEFLNRIAKEAVHELGHTFKLTHCKDNNCIMHYCRQILDVDRKSNILCRYCNIMVKDELKRLNAL